MSLPVMPATHTWVTLGPALGKAGRVATYAADDAQVWAWDEDTGLPITDLLDVNANPVTSVPIEDGWIGSGNPPGIGVPVAVAYVSFSVGQFGKRMSTVPVQTFKNAAASLAPTDTQVAALVADSGSSTAGALNATYGRRVGVHVSSYGAAGDGVADDTAAIEAARVALVALGGGTLDFGPAGKTYRVSKVTVSSDITYDGAGATVVGTSAISEAVFQAEGWSGGVTISDAVIKDFLIDAGGVARRGVFLYRATDCRVSGNRIYGFSTNGDTGVRLHHDTTACSVTDNHITMMSDVPFGTVPSGVGVGCVSNYPDVQGGGQNDTLTFSSALNPSQSHVITGNRIINGTHGVAMLAATDCVVANNFIQATTHRGVIMSPIALRNVVSGNRIKDFGSTAVHLAWGSRWNTITGNTCTTTDSRAEQDGIKGYFGCSDNTVTGNIVQGPAKAGIRFAMGSSRNTIVGNKVTGPPTGIKLMSYLPAAEGYYQPTTPGATEATIVGSNLTDGCATGISLESSGGQDVKDTTLCGNMLFGTTVSGVAFVEATGSVTGIDASGNSVRQTSGSAWTLPRGERHFRTKGANSALAGTPAAFLRSGLYYQATPSGSVTTINTLGNETLRLTPFSVPYSVTLSKIGVEVTAAGNAASVLRLGVYADDGNGYPAALVLDAGTVAADAVAVAELTISLALTPGTYWVGAAVQGAAATQPTVRGLGAGSGVVIGQSVALTGGSTPSAAASPAFAYAQTGVSGALPATFTTSVAPSAAAPRIFVKIA